MNAVTLYLPLRYAFAFSGRSICLAAYMHTRAQHTGWPCAFGVLMLFVGTRFCAVNKVVRPLLWAQPRQRLSRGVLLIGCGAVVYLLTLQLFRHPPTL